MIDATRIADNAHVILKRISKDDSLQEVEILKYFSQEPIASDPLNHTVPLLEELQPPDDPKASIVVLQVLRPYDNPEFDTIGEGLGFIYQLLEVRFRWASYHIGD